jgi:hypothetical protein
MLKSHDTVRLYAYWHGRISLVELVLRTLPKVFTVCAPIEQPHMALAEERCGFIRKSFFFFPERWANFSLRMRNKGIKMGKKERQKKEMEIKKIT